MPQGSTHTYHDRPDSPGRPDSDSTAFLAGCNPMDHSGVLRVKPGESPALTSDTTLWDL